MDKKEFIKGFPNREAIYVIYSKLTRLPYIVCNEQTFDDEVTIYTDRMMAEESAANLENEGRPSFALRVPRENNNYLRLFSEFYAYGVNAIQIYTEDDSEQFQISELVKKRDFSELPEKQRPLDNPTLQISMIYYMQEIRRQKEKIDNQLSRDLSEEMFANIMRAKYYFTFRVQQIDGADKTQLSLMRMRDGKSWFPVYTDPLELNKFVATQKGAEIGKDIKVDIITFDKLSSIPMPPESNGVLINPLGISVPLPLELMKHLMESRKQADE